MDDYIYLTEAISTATYSEVVFLCLKHGLTLDEFMMLAVKYLQDTECTSLTAP